MRTALPCLFALTVTLSAQIPTEPTSVPLEATLQAVFQPTLGPCNLTSTMGYSNFRLSLNYEATADCQARVLLLGKHAVTLPTGRHRRIEIAFEHLGTAPARIRLWEEGQLVEKGRELPASGMTGAGTHMASEEKSTRTLRLDRDFTAMVVFKTKGQGTLWAKAPPTGKWVRDAKALFIRDGLLVYDIGWLGAMRANTRVNDGKNHVAIVTSEDGKTSLYVDGALEATKEAFTKPDHDHFVFKTGSAATDFGGDYDGEFTMVRFWMRPLGAEEIKQLSTGEEDSVNTPDYNWAPEPSHPAAEETSFGPVPGYPTKITLEAGAGFQLKSAFIQPLELSDHAALIRAWGKESHARGETLYQQLCVTCHGTVQSPGSLPTALRFHKGTFKNGKDPYRMFQTLQNGYGLMVAQPQYSTMQKYDLIHYVREEFLKNQNEGQLSPIDATYLAKLPRGMSLRKEKNNKKRTPQYLLQDYGNALFWTLQVEEGNIAQKGIAIRVDPGPGGISKGQAWMLYDHDTMRLAACWTGDEFIDWRGIAFDGSHNSHTSIAGETHFSSPNLPMWANPATGEFEDARIRGRDGRPYGPLPREWTHFKGLELHGGRPVLRYTVGDCAIRELPGKVQGEHVFLRTFYCGPSSSDLRLRLDANRTHTFPASKQAFQFTVRYQDGIATVTPTTHRTPPPATPASRRFPGTLTTTIDRGSDTGPFAVDVLTPPAPDQNPWQSWMRTSGFDFFDDGKSAAVCTWNGDVWIVDGINQSEGELQWQRICAGLFQPLGLKIVDGEIFVGCRDMIAKLVDLNGDRETDYIESFNNDHQVTEHFHEFAMGLQTDAEGNFYYAKSARHALKAIVPHHGTLLRVRKDGSRTDILATGFRAANGVCLNPDGTFIVTDQEGHWNPKNRINWVQGNGIDDFYGNMYGYHRVTDESDEAMTAPLCWITNRFDRSPAELLWVPEDSAWTSLRGSLLNLSYGSGNIFVVPHETVEDQVQGGLCALPFERFPTGVMRGRFHPGDGQLYGCGMYAWAGNQKQPGGFYRIRATGKAAHLPVGLSTAKQTVQITFTDPLDRKSAENPKAWTINAWDLKRTKSYGSKHYNQRPWAVENAALSEDGKMITLTVPELAPTWGMSIQCNTHGANGEEVNREIHNSIYHLQERPESRPAPTPKPIP